MQTPPGRVISVNLAEVRELTLRGKKHQTGIWKVPFEGRVRAAGNSLEGDRQLDLKVHGGREKAVSCYASEDYHWWQEQLGAPMPPGQFGENLTLEGVDLGGALIGERWTIGSAEFQITQPRQPCWKLGAKMQERKFPRRFNEANRAGAYLSILQEGDVGAGDLVSVVHRPDHPITLGVMARTIYRQPQLAELIAQLVHQGLSGDEWAEVTAALDRP
ncbi:MAG: MOSC domain-containing protein [Actinomycetota bacterium]